MKVTITIGIKMIFIFTILFLLPNFISSQIRSDFMIDPDTSYSQSWPAVAFDKNGNWHIIWKNNGYIKQVIFNENAGVVRLPYLITNKPNLLWNYEIATNKNYAVVAYDEGLPVGGKAILAQILTLNGDPVIPRFPIPIGFESSAFKDVSFVTDTTFWVLLQDYKYPFFYQAICFQICTTSGKLVGASKVVNDDSLKNYYQCGVATICSNINAQRICVIWEDNSSGIESLYGRIYFPDSTPRSDRFMVTEENKEFSRGAVAADMDTKGDFIVVWSAQVDSCWNVYLRHFFADGTQKSECIKVNQRHNIGSVTWPDISIDNDNKFIVVWDEDIDNNSTIVGQRFSKNSNPIGDNFYISNQVSASIQSSAVVLLRNDKIYSAWLDDQPPGHKLKKFIWANILDFYNPTNLSNSVDPKNNKCFKLFQNYPNPFNSQTIISYELAEKKHIKLNIYDISGREIITLIDKVIMPGFYQIIWNGNDKQQHNMPSGIYVVILKADDIIQTKKIALVR